MVVFKIDDLQNMTARLKIFADFLREQNVTEEDVFFSRLVSCELLSNVIRHGGGTAEFKGTLLSDRIEISVTAKGQEGVNLTPAKPEVLSEGGRGIYIINAVSMSGIQRGEGGELKVYIRRTAGKQ